MANAPMICFVGPLPPPTHGMANVNAAMLSMLQERARVVAYPVMPAIRSSGLSYHVSKGWRATRALAGLLATRLRGARVFYGSVDDGWGGVWTIAIALLARLCGYRIFLHHHSYRYVDRKTRLMRALTQVAGAGTCHIVLCDAMESAFKLNYPDARNTVTVPNLVLPTSPAQASRARPNFVIGMLSNLTLEKGLPEFLRLFGAARSLGWNISAVLAGPAADASVRDLLTDAIGLHGGTMTWLGEVHGAMKEGFFQAIDAFVFPTRYASECYPLVILEALSAGCPAISTDQGCLGSLSSYQSVDIIARHSDFVEAALPILRRLMDSPRRQLFDQAIEDATAIADTSKRAREMLIARMVSR